MRLGIILGFAIILNVLPSMHAFSNDTSKISLDQTDIWNRTFGGSDQEKGASVQQTGDGGYIIAGSTYKTSSQVDGDNDI